MPAQISQYCFLAGVCDIVVERNRSYEIATNINDDTVAKMFFTEEKT